MVVLFVRPDVKNGQTLPSLLWLVAQNHLHCLNPVYDIFFTEPHTFACSHQPHQGGRDPGVWLALYFTATSCLNSVADIMGQSVGKVLNHVVNALTHRHKPPPPPPAARRDNGFKVAHACTPEAPWVNTTAPPSFSLPVVVALVINAPDLKARYEYVKQQLRAIDMPYSRLYTAVANAHRRTDICKTNDAMYTVHVNGTYKKPANPVPGIPERTLSLLYNHVEAWNRVARRSHITLVLEDDVNISSSFKETLRQTLWQLREQPWDIIWPGYCCCTPNGPAVTPDLARHSLTGCTQSYIIHQHSAQRMLRAMPTDQCYGSDHYMNHLFPQVPCWKGYAFRRNLIPQDKTKFPISSHRHPHEAVVSW